ncbi:MAG: hypothetical protein CMD65_04770 [Gammaproteobacteria bacterium]|nr:hypothetical protein [Gammaproteobacteria bacterium]|tara:strand:+ start:127 stop:804 length:678 start_codon:yes stop_codon:yes gene_type:complete
MKNYNIIFIHGWLFDSRIWFGLDDLLNQNYDINRIDLPGYGKNTNNFRDYKNFFEEIFANNTNNTCLITFSFGCTLTFLALQRNYKYINKIIQINPVYNLEKNIITTFKKNLNKSRDETIKKFIFECVKGSKSFKDEYEKIIDNFDFNTLPSNEILCNHLDNYNKLHNKQNNLRKDVSILNIMSENDYIMSNENIDGYLLKNASHIPFISHKKELYTVITSFLNT